MGVAVAAPWVAGSGLILFGNGQPPQYTGSNPRRDTFLAHFSYLLLGAHATLNVQPRGRWRVTTST